MSRSISLLGITAFSFLLICCEDEGGMLTVETWGEEFIEEGIPSDELVDGFSITYDAFLVAIGDVSVAREGAAAALEAPDQRVWDLTGSGPFEIVAGDVSAGTYSHTAFSISPAEAEAISGNASDEDLELMIDAGYSVYVEGSATNGTDTVTFAWGFSTDTLYDPCHSKGGLEAGGELAVQLTIHGDHLFYDDAVSENPSLRFADIAAADSDIDGHVSPDELEAYDITVLANYGVGSLPIDNMWDFISHMTTTLGHIDGEGHCETTVK